MAGGYHGTTRKSAKAKKAKTYRGKPRRAGSHFLAAAKKDPWQGKGVNKGH